MALRDRWNHSSCIARQSSCPRFVSLTYWLESFERMLVMIAIGMSGSGVRPGTVPAAWIFIVSRISAARGPGGVCEAIESKTVRKAVGYVLSIVPQRFTCCSCVPSTITMPAMSCGYSETYRREMMLPYECATRMYGGLMGRACSSAWRSCTSCGTEWSDGPGSERPNPEREYAIAVVNSDIERTIGSHSSRESARPLSNTRAGPPLPSRTTSRRWSPTETSWWDCAPAVPDAAHISAASIGSRRPSDAEVERFR